MTQTAIRSIPQKSKSGSQSSAKAVVEVSMKSAKDAGLHYVSDERPGISRQRKGESFVYADPRGKRVRDAKTLARIKSLVIPPAWEEVWISPDPQGHIQAVGRDARKRKQYKYHPRWREVRDQDKYDKLIAFGQALPLIRKRTTVHLKLPGLPREKVLAAVIQVMEKTLIRVGNDEYARQNDSFGLTTLRDKHARISGSRVRFDFTGKSGVRHEIDFEDPKLARIVQKCQDLPGFELFQYLDEKNQVRDVTSTDVNSYLREITGQEFTAKDFRTWAGTVLAARALQEMTEVDSQTQAKKNIVQAIETVAKRLGNTKAVCRKCYVHPAIIDTYLDGSLLESLSKQAAKTLATSTKQLPPEEAAVLALLHRRLSSNASSKKKKA